MITEDNRYSVWVHGKLCQRQGTYLARVLGNKLMISPPPVHGYPILIIYVANKIPYKQEFVGTSVDTVFTLAHSIDHDSDVTNHPDKDSGYL